MNNDCLQGQLQILPRKDAGRRNRNKSCLHPSADFMARPKGICTEDLVNPASRSGFLGCPPVRSFVSQFDAAGQGQ